MKKHNFKARICLVAALLAPALCQPAEAELKPLIHGLISMGDIRFHKVDGGVPDNSLAGISAAPGVFAGVVINITWAQLQPTPEVLTTEPIDQALAAVRTYNAANPAKPLAVNLRIWPGPNAPEWIKSLGGPPVEIHRIYPNQPKTSITIGRFWSAPYRQAWIKLQTALGHKYDPDPLIRETSNTSCSSYTDEPFVLAADPESLSNMQRAGFSDAAFRACLLQSVKDFDAWPDTRLQNAVNPFRKTDGGRPVLAPEISEQIVTQWRRELGQRAVLSNHALQRPEHPWIAPVLEQIRKFGPPVEFQTEAPKAGSGLDWDGTMDEAVGLKGTAVEVWAGGAPVAGFEVQPKEKLRQWSQLLEQPGRYH